MARKNSDPVLMKEDMEVEMYTKNYHAGIICDLRFGSALYVI